MADPGPDTEEQPPDDSKPKTTVPKKPGIGWPKGKPRGPRASSSAAAKPEITQTQARRGLYSVFSSASRFLRSDAEFEEKEFEELAGSLMALGRRFPPLFIFMTALLPFSVIAELFNKMMRLNEGRARRREREAVNGADQYVQPAVRYGSGQHPEL